MQFQSLLEYTVLHVLSSWNIATGLMTPFRCKDCKFVLFTLLVTICTEVAQGSSSWFQKKRKKEKKRFSSPIIPVERQEHLVHIAANKLRRLILLSGMWRRLWEKSMLSLSPFIKLCKSQPPPAPASSSSQSNAEAVLSLLKNLLLSAKEEWEKLRLYCSLKLSRLTTSRFNGHGILPLRQYTLQSNRLCSATAPCYAFTVIAIART